MEDPYDEFMIKENWEDLQENKESFWSSKYYITEKEEIPTFLQPFAHKILLAGKYLNITRINNFKNENNLKKNEFKFSFFLEISKYSSIINSALNFANESILKLFLEEKHIQLRIENVSKTFFLLSSDYLSFFIDSAYEELLKTDLDARKEDLQTTFYIFNFLIFFILFFILFFYLYFLIFIFFYFILYLYYLYFLFFLFCFFYFLFFIFKFFFFP